MTDGHLQPEISNFATIDFRIGCLLSKSGGHLETEIWCISRRAANEDILIQQGNRKINWRLDSVA